MYGAALSAATAVAAEMSLIFLLPPKCSMCSWVFTITETPLSPRPIPARALSMVSMDASSPSPVSTRAGVAPSRK